MHSLVSRVEAAKSRKELVALSGLADASDVQEFFERVSRLAGSEPQAASRLADRWQAFVHADRALALRARAVGERAKGQWLKSDTTLQLAAEATSDPLLSLTYSIGRVDSLARAGRPDAANKLGTRLAQELERRGAQAEAARAWLNTANALLWSDRYTDAIETLDRALPHLDGVDAASAILALSTAHLFGGSASRSLSLAREAEAMLDRLGLEHYARLAQYNQGYALALTGRVEEGLSILREKGGLDEDPRTAELLADIYRDCGLVEESIFAGEVALRGATGLNRADAHLGLGLSLAQAGKWISAIRRFELAANAFRRAGNRVWLAYARARAAIARLESEGVGIVALRTAVQKLRKANAHRLYAECLLDLAHWEAKNGTLPPGRLQECRSALARLGGSREEWRLEEITARASGDLTHLAAALAALARERDQLASPVLRAAFMRSKEGLLGHYVSVLAQTPGGAREAMKQVRSHRAVGFVEEIAALHSDALPQGLTSTVARLREELATLDRDYLRRSSPSSDAELSLLTEWSEAHLTLSSATINILENVPAPDLVWVVSDEVTHVLSVDTILTIGLSRAETARRLRALRFEIAGAPMGGAADVAQAEAAIQALADLLPRDLPNQTLCPEGQLWQVPWSALVDAGAEPVLALAPFAPDVGATLPSDPEVLVWEADWDDLPHVREEGELVLSRFPGARVCRSLAEARESLAEGSYDLLHVATHARAHPTSPLFSTISFPDGDLYAFEIMGSPARIGAVVLTACEAASVGGSNPFEPEGTGRAFLSRGASVVVGPIWPLDDKAGKTFVESLYDTLGRSGGWADSVASARQKVRDAMPHPYYWAPFATLGGYR